jgi:hypothetical protein
MIFSFLKNKKSSIVRKRLFKAVSSAYIDFSIRNPTTLEARAEQYAALNAADN